MLIAFSIAAYPVWRQAFKILAFFMYLSIKMIVNFLLLDKSYSDTITSETSWHSSKWSVRTEEWPGLWLKTKEGRSFKNWVIASCNDVPVKDTQNPKSSVTYVGILCYLDLNLYFLVSSADNFCKQFGPRPGLTKCRAWSGSNLFDTQMVFLKQFWKKRWFWEKNQQTTKKHEKYPMGGAKSSVIIKEHNISDGLVWTYISLSMTCFLSRRYISSLWSCSFLANSSSIIANLCIKSSFWTLNSSRDANFPSG